MRRMNHIKPTGINAFRLSGLTFIILLALKNHYISCTSSNSAFYEADHGRDNFVAYYFNGKVLNWVLPEEEQNAVISQLFYWEIPVKIDKLT